jgi:hypothetical protein
MSGLEDAKFQQLNSLINRASIYSKFLADKLEARQEEIPLDASADPEAEMAKEGRGRKRKLADGSAGEVCWQFEWFLILGMAGRRGRTRCSTGGNDGSCTARLSDCGLELVDQFV